ncbi:putative Fungal N-terminal domain-containing protein [Seiridium unicorne]|uniref:Fungal N-terminal domain-containing protein n=1 Tax=Seiridium unicorne TaxID=138068 RepID=A0ABR2VB21_9PEZI
MDPLSVTTSVTALTAACLKTTKAMGDLCEKFKHAQMTLSAICSESTVICASLSQIQSLVLTRPDALRTQLRERSELVATFDIAVTGCMVIYAVLDDEVQSIMALCVDGQLGWFEKAKVLWKEDTMSGLLQQLRGQQHAISLLIQVLQLESLSDIHRLVAQHGLMLERIKSQTRSLRFMNPRVRAPGSIFEDSLDNESILGTVATDTTFLFDDLIVNAKVYRRVLAQAGSQDLRAKEELKEGPDSNTALVSDGEAWIDSLEKAYSRLQADEVPMLIIKTTLEDADFEEELSAITQWFNVLNEAERITSLSRLLGMIEYPSTERSKVDIRPITRPQNPRYGVVWESLNNV